MMTKRKERVLQELYDRTHQLSHPEITPILKGSCRIQGPVDVGDASSHKDMDSPPPYKRVRVETGTCNVCAAPCSSCMHFGRTESGMESKIEEECSNIICGDRTASKSKRRGCSERQTTVSETSNLLSASSSHGSYSENAESKLSVRGQNEVEDVEAVRELGKEGAGILREHAADRPQCTASRGISLSCPETENDFDNENVAAKSTKLGAYKQGGGSSGGEASDTEKSSLPLQHVFESEQSGSDVIEDDVKVCDICGDAGREELLAICSKCSDGAEHTYCMRMMLDKVPEGEWLCEGCKVEVDVQKENSERNEGLAATTSKGQQLDEKDRISANDSRTKLFQKSDIKDVIDEKSTYNKAVASPHISAKRQSDNLEVSSMPKRDTNERVLREVSSMPKRDTNEIVLREVSSMPKRDTKEVSSMPKRDTNEIVLREVSSMPKRDTNEIVLREVSSMPKRDTKEIVLKDSDKRASLSREYSSKNLEATKLKYGKHPATNNADEASHSVTSSVTSSSRVHQLPPPRGLLSRSNTFSNINVKPKVKRIQDDMCQKQKLGKESGINDVKKEGFSRTMNKSLSFKTTSLGYLNASDSKLKDQSQSEDSRGLKFAKGKHLLERRSSFNIDNLSVSSLPPALNSASLLKTVLPTTGANNGSSVIAADSAGEVKKQTSLNVACNSGDQRQRQAVGKEETKTKDFNLTSRPRQPLLARPRSGRCAKCDNTGHTAEFCPASDLRCPSVKTPAAKSSREGANKTNKWKDVIRAALSKVTGPNNTSHNGRSNSTNCDNSNKLSDQNNEPSISNTVLSSEIAISKDQLSSSSNGVRNLPSQEATYSAREVGNIHFVADEANLKPCMVKVSTHDSLLSHTLRNSSIPEHDYIWQGGFEILRNGESCLEFFDGFQAHLSTIASHKVLEVVKKFPYKVELEEVSRLSSWPVQFQEKGTTEDNIALYIFAKDVESYDRHYKKLVENMIKNDLALKANIDEVELFIYSSNQLPEKAHRWNRLYYLWAVFRERRADCPGPRIGSQNNCGATITVEPSIKGRSNLLTSKVKTVQEIASVNFSAELSTSCTLPEPSEIVKPDVSLNLPSVPFPKVEGSASSTELPSDQQLEGLDLKQSAVRNSVPSQNYILTRSSRGHTSSSETQPVNVQSIGSEVSGIRASVKEVNEDFKTGDDKDHQPSAQATNIQSPLDKGKVFPVCIDDEKANVILSSVDIQENSSSSFKTILVPSCTHVKELVGEGGLVNQNREVQEKGKLMANRSCIDINACQVQALNEEVSWNVKSGKKRNHLVASERIFEPSVETTLGGQGMSWDEKTNIVEGNKELKKMKYYSEPKSWIMSAENRSSDYSFSKVDLNGNYCFEDDVRSNALRNDEPLFHVDIGPTKGFSLDNSVPLHVISDDDEPPEADLPNLDLALGSEKIVEKEALPLFLQLIDDKSNKTHTPATGIDEGDDVASASLSLSLAFPFSRNEQSAKPVSKPEQVITERERVSTSLVLFGGFTDT